jgi:glycogen debranching enzyme
LLDADGYYDSHLEDPLVRENVFRTMPPEDASLPTFGQAATVLPEPFWEGHGDAVACYWKVWELAFGNLRRPAPRSGFVANFIDTAFNDCLFMWDSAFILLFARYGARAFDFGRTLDNLYAKQHPDGFICREIGTEDGRDRFQRFDPAGTGPNVMPWTEWEHFWTTGDRERLARVFPVLLAYHRWLKRYRTWPDGTYWTTGLGSGMDNQPRVPEREAEDREGWPERLLDHAHLVWVDACLQQALSAGLLVRMADELGRGREVGDLREERETLARAVNDRLWDEGSAFYFDGLPDGSLSGLRTVGAYWALLAGVVPEERMGRFVSHLEDPQKLDRPHRVPSIPTDHPEYRPDGGYWLGGVWPPTNYMVLRGLDRAGYHDLAHAIALNHLDNVVRVFGETGTVWENYAPEMAAPGEPARPDFVGWSGLGPVAGLFEYVFGLRADVPNRRLVWDVRLLEGHGIRRYPFGREGVLDLSCGPRTSTAEEPRVEARSTVPLEVLVRWDGGERTLRRGGA